MNDDAMSESANRVQSAEALARRLVADHYENAPLADVYLIAAVNRCMIKALCDALCQRLVIDPDEINVLIAEHIEKLDEMVSQDSRDYT